MPAKQSRRFHYTHLPNAVISATSHSKTVTQAVLSEFPMVFSHSFHSVLLYDTKYTSCTVQEAQNRHLKVLHVEVEWWSQFSENFAEI
jgi:hypothetical protein